MPPGGNLFRPLVLRAQWTPKRFVPSKVSRSISDLQRCRSSSLGCAVEFSHRSQLPPSSRCCHRNGGISCHPPFSPRGKESFVGPDFRHGVRLLPIKRGDALNTYTALSQLRSWGSDKKKTTPDDQAPSRLRLAEVFRGSGSS